MSAIEYTRAVEADYEDLLDFANYVFRLDFYELLPKLYKREYNKTGHHYIVKENGKIKAAVGSFPMEIMICGEKIKVAGIGTVSVHPYSRRKGYMRALMEMAMEEMKENDVDLACLGGQRQRYAYFSFERCGVVVEYTVTPENIRHVYGNGRPAGTEIREVKPDDGDILAEIMKLHSAQPIHVTREPREFYDIARSWKRKIFAVFQDGEFAGYLAADGDFGKVPELFIKENTTLENVIREIYHTYKPGHTVFQCAPWQVDHIMFFETIAERWTVNQSCNLSILNFIKVIRALMRLKATYTTLTDGELTLCINGAKGVQGMKIRVENGNPTVEEFNGDYDIVLDHLEAMRFLLSPTAHLHNTGGGKKPLLVSWFPLPLHYPVQDNV